jgi:hypothetical protein
MTAAASYASMIYGGVFSGSLRTHACGEVGPDLGWRCSMELRGVSVARCLTSMIREWGCFKYMSCHGPLPELRALADDGGNVCIVVL